MNVTLPGSKTFIVQALRADGFLVSKWFLSDQEQAESEICVIL